MLCFTKHFVALFYINIYRVYIEINQNYDCNFINIDPYTHVINGKRKKCTLCL